MIVSVVYALPDRQCVCELDLPDGSTLETALRQSGLMREIPEIRMADVLVGVHGHVRPMHTVLREGDRVEIYRPLGIEPKDARRQRLQKR